MEPPSFPCGRSRGLLVYAALALWLVVSVLVRVVRLDWTYASLMLLPIPILGPLAPFPADRRGARLSMRPRRSTRALMAW